MNSNKNKSPKHQHELSRREFLKLSGVAAATALLGGSLVACDTDDSPEGNTGEQSYVSGETLLMPEDGRYELIEADLYNSPGNSMAAGKPYDPNSGATSIPGVILTDPETGRTAGVQTPAGTAYGRGDARYRRGGELYGESFIGQHCLCLIDISDGKFYSYDMGFSNYGPSRTQYANGEEILLHHPSDGIDYSDDIPDPDIAEYDGYWAETFHNGQLYFEVDPINKTLTARAYYDDSGDFWPITRSRGIDDIDPCFSGFTRLVWRKYADND